jgi:membrane-bound lytic murein transglycosylase B
LWPAARGKVEIMLSPSRVRRGAPVLAVLAALAVTPTFDRATSAGAVEHNHPAKKSQPTNDSAIRPVTPSAPDEPGGTVPRQPAHRPLGVPDTPPKKHSHQQQPSISELTTGGIPQVALQAYHQAAAELAQSAPNCHLPWALLAGIGRVESDEGQYGGAALQADGNESKPIVGPRLDGSQPGMARITDTDHGRYDGDKSFDRAVGPMQFLPGTWAAVGVDADGNGVADPENIFDAAAGAGVYLCAGGANLSTTAGQAAAVLSYNHSQSYVGLVLALMHAYQKGTSIAALGAGHPIAPDRALSPPISDVPKQSGRRDVPAKKHHKADVHNRPTVRTKPTSTPTPTRPTPVPKQHKPIPTPAPTPKAPSVVRDVQTDALADNSLQLEWTAPASTGSGVSGYRVTVTSAAGKPVGKALSLSRTADHVALPTLPKNGVFTVSISALSRLGTQQSTGPAAQLAVATLLPADLTGVDAANTVTAQWTWDAVANQAVQPDGFAIQVLDKDGSSVGQDTAKADERSKPLTLDPDATGDYTVQVWAVFTTKAGLAGVTEPIAAPVTESTSSPTPTPTPTPSSTPSAGNSPSATPTPSTTPTPTPTD